MFGDFARQTGEVTELCFIASGMSMYPFIVGGRDRVTLRREPHIRKHDIVAAHIPGRGYVLHRVYKVEGSQLTLMGDGNLVATERCVTGDVVGVVAKINDAPCGSTSFSVLSAAWVNLRFMRKPLLWIIKKLDPRL